MSQPGTRGAPYVGYQLRPIVVAPDLGALHGPTHGSHQLPRRLDSSARAYFDFAVLGGRTATYQLVLLEAADVADHEPWLQRTQLLELWAELYLPRAVRAAWQSTHPELARIGAGLRWACAPRRPPPTDPDSASARRSPRARSSPTLLPNWTPARPIVQSRPGTGHRR